MLYIQRVFAFIMVSMILCQGFLNSHDPKDPALDLGNRTFGRCQSGAHEFGQTAIEIGLPQPCRGYIGIMLISRTILTRKAPAPQRWINLDDS
jgi:hypothetical protein